MARLGASLCDTVEELVRLRGPVAEKTAEIVRRHRLDEYVAALLVVDAEKAFDRLLIALVKGYSAAR